MTNYDDRYHDKNSYNGGWNKDNDKKNDHNDNDDYKEKKLDESVCYMEYESGPCEANIERYFYNYKNDKCELFIYGGCYGNLNNFESKSICESFANKYCIIY